VAADRAEQALRGAPATDACRRAGDPPPPRGGLAWAAHLLDRPLVARLNELQGFLSANGEGLSLDVLRDIYAAATYPLGVVGRGPR
jgi:hypothetical protein